MSKNHRLAKSLLDATFSKLLEYIEWKCACLGKYYYQVDPYYASSQICNHCGNKSEITKDLRIREWECPKCGNLLDRDINASINIMYEGIKIHYKEIMNLFYLLFDDVLEFTKENYKGYSNYEAFFKEELIDYF